MMNVIYEYSFSFNHSLLPKDKLKILIYNLFVCLGANKRIRFCENLHEFQVLLEINMKSFMYAENVKPLVLKDLIL